MGKKIRIYESEIKRATRRKLMENYLSEDYEMRDTYSKAKFKPTPREKGIEGVFGQYGEDMDPAVIRYMRKNPDHILRRMAELYPEIYMRHAPVQPDYRDYPEPIDVSLDEAEEMTVYGKGETPDLSKVEPNGRFGVTLDDKGTIGTFTRNNESTQKLFKRFLNRK